MRRRDILSLSLLVLVGVLLGTGCGPSKEPTPAARQDPAPAAQPKPARQEFAVKGVVREVFPGERKIRIRHEEIPDYMPAMTMMFDVQEAKELEGLAVSDEVTFRMVVTEEDGWIEDVRKVGHVTEVTNAVPSSFRLVRDVEPLEEGDLMPDYRFTNELGQATSLESYRGRALVLTFIFTRCPYPDFCPRMSRLMNELLKGLQTAREAPDNWHLFSVTIDPEFDTPNVLRSYAQAYQYDPERWSFLTGPLIDITAISEQFGLQFYRPEPDKPAELNHNLRTAIIDASGKVRKILVGNEWKPEEVLPEIIAAAAAAGSL